tara:strand:- start:95 stop:1612 length:1518 start_codon:yes stop_codon:yes gene_type:complete
MIPIGTVLLTLGIIVCAVALRGRIAARGHFCRKCKFDLAGLDPTSACPECGQDLTAPDATSGVLRRVHRPGFVTAIVLLLSGLGTAGFAVWTRGGSVYARLPDAALLALDRVGVDEALSEIAVRSDAYPGFSTGHWGTLLTRGLAHQSDSGTPWDPRWGQVLANAFLRQQMTPEQMQAYIAAGIKPDIRIRDRAAADQRALGFRVSWDTTRIKTPAGFGGNAGRISIYDAIATTGSVGVVTPEGEYALGGRATTEGPFVIPSGAGFWGETSSSSIQLRGFDPADPPEEITAFVEAGLTIKAGGDAPQVIVALGPFRTEQVVRILPAGSAIVGLVSDQTAAEATRDAVEISDLRLDLGEGEQSRWNRANLRFRVTSFTHALAGRLYVVFAGEETELGELSLPAGGETNWHLGGSVARGGRGINQEDPVVLARLRAWADAGVVDLVFRSDPAAALHNPDIDQIADVTLWFRDVPVTVVVPNQQAWFQRPVHRAEGAAPIGEAEPAGG